MKKINISASVTVYENANELTEKDIALLAEAQRALQKSYAPYSGFAVGAAARLENGQLFSGANQENAAYPLCLCAEMVVMSAVSAQQPGAVIQDLAITVSGGAERLPDAPAAPCGACRQTLLEYENRQKSPIRILLTAPSGKVFELEDVKSLLPLYFDGTHLA